MMNLDLRFEEKEWGIYNLYLGDCGIEVAVFKPYLAFKRSLYVVVNFNIDKSVLAFLIYSSKRIEYMINSFLFKNGFNGFIGLKKEFLMAYRFIF